MGDRKHATSLYNAAVTAANDKTYSTNLTTAYQMFASACLADPTWAEAWYQYGNNNSDLNLLAASVAAQRRALECETDPILRAKILCNLGWRLHGLGRSQEALKVSEQAWVLDPTLAYVHVNLSCIHGALCDADKALAHAREAYKLAPDDATVRMALAFALLFARKFTEGFQHFESRFRYRLHNFLSFPYPPWEGQKGATVFLVADQGLGDTLSFARFVKLAAERAGYLHIMLQGELMRAFQHAFRHLTNVNLLPMPCPFPAADYWSTFVSLPYALGLSDEAVRITPQVDLPVYTLPKTWRVADRKLHIGIAWAGSPLNDIDRHRNIPVTQFLELYRVPGIQLYSLQVGERAKDLHDNGCAALIRDLSPYIRDVTDTVSLLQDLDLVICCESAMGHIAAAANKPCWIPYSYCGRDYRIGLDGSDMIWTPKHRVFRQGPDQQWGPVFDEIVKALEGL